ncbi:MAG TPA: carboxypeptidase regulatory-like domain-containing protein, partial [Melioribacteraceae bacterium]|nr:carboxypeptidase regulatory-like domain-containing protein [Melioribacteraceae bacterium]
STVSDSTGAYSLSDLLPGKYYLFACSFPDYIPTYFRFDGTLALHRHHADSLIILENTILTDVNFTLINRNYNGNGMITGTIMEDNNNPITGAVVVAFNENGEVVSSSVSDVNGNYRLNNLRESNYNLFVNKYDYNQTEIYNVPVFDNNFYSAIANVSLTPETITAVKIENNMPSNFSLSQNYPNPFNPETTINFTLPTQQQVSLKVYDVLGNEIATLVNEIKQAGSYEIKFNASKYSSGIYFYSLKSGNFSKTLKMTLIK